MNQKKSEAEKDPPNIVRKKTIAFLRQCKAVYHKTYNTLVELADDLGITYTSLYRNRTKLKKVGIDIISAEKGCVKINYGPWLKQIDDAKWRKSTFKVYQPLNKKRRAETHLKMWRNYGDPKRLEAHNHEMATLRRRAPHILTPHQREINIKNTRSTEGGAPPQPSSPSADIDFLKLAKSQGLIKGRPRRYRQAGLLHGYAAQAYDVVMQINQGRQQIDASINTYISTYALLEPIAGLFNVGITECQVKKVIKCKINDAKRDRSKLKWLNPWIIMNPYNFQQVLEYLDKLPASREEMEQWADPAKDEIVVLRNNPYVPPWLKNSTARPPQKKPVPEWVKVHENRPRMAEYKPLSGTPDWDGNLATIAQIRAMLQNKDPNDYARPMVRPDTQFVAPIKNEVGEILQNFSQRLASADCET